VAFVGCTCTLSNVDLSENIISPIPMEYSLSIYIWIYIYNIWAMNIYYI
jgi:hypothetical protein